MAAERKGIKALAKEASLLPQEELLQLLEGQSDLTIGIPKETSLQETRVALVPEAVALLVAHGHQVIVESGAGESAYFSDIEYSESGARISRDRKEVFQSGLVLKVEPLNTFRVYASPLGAFLFHKIYQFDSCFFQA